MIVRTKICLCVHDMAYKQQTNNSILIFYNKYQNRNNGRRRLISFKESEGCWEMVGHSRGGGGG